MRLTHALSAAVVAAFLMTPASDAKAAHYCLTGDIDLCGFVSMEQCLQAVTGLAAFCVVDPSEASASTPQPKRKH